MSVCMSVCIYVLVKKAYIIYKKIIKNVFFMIWLAKVIYITYITHIVKTIDGFGYECVGESTQQLRRTHFTRGIVTRFARHFYWFYSKLLCVMFSPSS